MSRPISYARPAPPFAPSYSNQPGSFQADADALGMWVSFYSKTLGRTVGLALCLPADYFTDPKQPSYPVVWHMHGLQTAQIANEGYGAGWFPASYGAARRAGVVRKHITVFPNGLDRYMWIDNYDGSAPLETYFINDVISYVQANFRVLTDKRSNVCAGFSMGSRAAVYYAFKYPERFYGAHSYGAPLYDETADFANLADVADWGPYVLSPSLAYTASERARWLACSPQGWLDNARPALRIVHGASDALTRNLGSAFRNLLTARGIAHETAPDLPGVIHNANQHWTNADSLNAFGFFERIFSGAL